LRRNAYYKIFISEKKRQGMNITFVTPSKYEEDN